MRLFLPLVVGGVLRQPFDTTKIRAYAVAALDGLTTIYQPEGASK